MTARSYTPTTIIFTLWATPVQNARLWGIAIPALWTLKHVLEMFAQ